MLDNREAEARAAERAAARLVDAVEAFEEVRQMLGGNSDAEVRDSDRDATAGGRRGDADRVDPE